MAKSLEQGDQVAWQTSQGETQGTVEKKVTSPTRIKGHEVKATEDDPQYVVQSDKTGARAAHKPGALKRR